MRARTALPLCIALMVMTSGPLARAQTANASPTAPAPAGLPGVSPGVSRVAPSTGPAQPGLAGAMPQIVTETDKQFLAQQRKDDRDMTICKGC